jgi:outer membrane protein W
MQDKIKPYVGASATYIRRVYQQRVQSGAYWVDPNSNKSTDDLTTDAVNVGLMAGVDFEASTNLLIGGGIDYNRNMFNKESTFSNYNLPANTRPLEEFDYYTMKVSLKYLF